MRQIMAFRKKNSCENAICNSTDACTFNVTNGFEYLAIKRGRSRILINFQMCVYIHVIHVM